MRILSGKWAGKDLLSPSGRVRPTSEELREVWMRLIDRQLKDARVIDLFAGSGSVGIEALSRGAKSCDFVENNPSALHALKANVARIKARDRTRIFKRDAIQFVERIDKVAYDIAFADPPYGSRKLDRVVKDWHAAPFSEILTVEHAADHELPFTGKRRVLDESAITSFFRPE